MCEYDYLSLIGTGKVEIDFIERRNEPLAHAHVQLAPRG